MTKRDDHTPLVELASERERARIAPHLSDSIELTFEWTYPLIDSFDVEPADEGTRAWLENLDGERQGAIFEALENVVRPLKGRPRGEHPTTADVLRALAPLVHPAAKLTVRENRVRTGRLSSAF